jgi:hypothetical protein
MKTKERQENAIETRSLTRGGRGSAIFLGAKKCSASSKRLRNTAKDTHGGKIHGPKLVGGQCFLDKISQEVIYVWYIFVF